MDHMHDQIRIDAPVEHVWAFYRDTTRWRDWMPRMEYSEPSGPVDQVGTTYLQHFRLMGFEMKSSVKVVEVEPLRLIHERVEFGDKGEDNYLRFEPDGDGTLMTVDSDYEMPGHLPGFVKDLLTKRFMERNVRQMLEDFKAFAEVSVPVPA
jgi:uncharacterized membrane protein